MIRLATAGRARACGRGRRNRYATGWPARATRPTLDQFTSSLSPWHHIHNGQRAYLTIFSLVTQATLCCDLRPSRFFTIVPSKLLIVLNALQRPCLLYPHSAWFELCSEKLQGFLIILFTHIFFLSIVNSIWECKCSNQCSDLPV